MRLSRSGLSDFALPRAPSPDRVAFLRAQPFAHRGLHGAGAVENSLSAFRAAVAVGHGIELDIQLAANDEPMVFHDDHLDRLTAETGAVSERTGRELAGIRLFGTEDTIPSLAEVLALVAGRVPLLIEIKSVGPNVNHVCLAVRRALEGYVGTAAVMSLDERVPAWFHEHAKRIPRGLVVSEPPVSKLIDRIRARVDVLRQLRRSRPDFVAYDLRDIQSPLVTRLRRRGIPVLAWTIRTPSEARLGLNHADEIIYERAAA